MRSLISHGSFLLLCMFSCAPIPMVQSARVTGLTGVSASYVSSMVDVDAQIRHVCTNCSTAFDTATKMPFRHDEGRILPRVGIGDRVELMLIAIPYFYPPFFLASGNLKIALFDVGDDRMFNNFSMALFSGGDLFPMEHDRWHSLWGGLVFGTHATGANNDLELVCMCFGKQFTYDFAYAAIDKIMYRTADLTFGLIYRPFRQQRIEVNAGVTSVIPLAKQVTVSEYSYFYKPEFPGSNFTNSMEYSRFRIDPVVVQCGVSLYLARDKQK